MTKANHSGFAIFLIVLCLIATQQVKSLITQKKLDGTYKIERLNGQPLDFDARVLFVDDNLSFKGCNVHSASVEQNDDGSFTIGPFSSTLMYCLRDKDPEIIRAFRSAVRLEESNDNVAFFGSDGQEALYLKQLTRAPDQSPRPQNNNGVNGTGNVIL